MPTVIKQTDSEIIIRHDLGTRVTDLTEVNYRGVCFLPFAGSTVSKMGAAQRGTRAGWYVTYKPEDSAPIAALGSMFDRI